MTPELDTSVAAERNKQPLLEQLRLHLPADASVLELASGTGQHVVHFAQALPLSSWQPSDPDPQNLLTIATRSDAARLRNVHQPLELDVHQVEWRVPDDFDAVLAVNLIHIAPWSATPALFAGAARVLRAEGARRVLLYGAYREAGAHSSPSNAEFDASLKSRNPDWGVRDIEAVIDVAAGHGFRLHTLTRMPANNLLLVFAP